MPNIIDILNKEKELNDLDVSPKFNDYEKLNNEYNSLFKHPFYEMSNKWLNNGSNHNLILSLHDSYVIDFSQKRNGNEYSISFLVDASTIYDNNVEVGFLYLNRNQIKTISIKYSDIEFTKGEMNLYEKEEKSRLNFK